MSFTYTDAVIEMSDEYEGEDEIAYTSKDRTVLLDLAERTNDDTKMCFPSFGKIASRVRLSQRTVIRSIATLEKLGLTKVEPGTVRLTNTYTLDLAKIQSLAPDKSKAKPFRNKRLSGRNITKKVTTAKQMSSDEIASIKTTSFTLDEGDDDLV